MIVYQRGENTVLSIKRKKWNSVFNHLLNSLSSEMELRGVHVSSWTPGRKTGRNLHPFQ